MTRTMNWVLGAVGVGLLLLPPRIKAGEPAGVDLSGHWRLNAELSDNPREVFQKKMEEMRAKRGDADERGGGMRGEHGGWGGGGGHSGGPHQRRANDDDSTPGQTRQRTSPLEAPREITILQNGDQVTMVYASGDTLTIVPDGQTRKVRAPSGEVELDAVWKDLVLQVHTKRTTGTEITRLYRINNDGRLEIGTLVQLPRTHDTAEIVSRYDEVTASSQPPSGE
jgi:hypothetical protein